MPCLVSVDANCNYLVLVANIGSHAIDVFAEPPLDDPRGHASARRPIDVRRHNLALVLRQTATRGSISRAEIARATGLTKGTVSVLVQELLKLGLLLELGPQTDGRVGRPRSALGVNGELHCGVGCEINVDYLAVSVADLLHRVRFHRVEAIDNREVPPARVLERAARLLETALDAAATESLAVAGVGVAVPGVVEVAEGRLLLAPNLGWSNLDIGDELSRRLARPGLPLLVDNEANLAALGELWLGVGGDIGDYVHVSGEIGIGAGVIVGGGLFRGSRGFAGEMGHVVVDPNGPSCACGGRGCLERVAGQEAILRAAGLPTAPGTSLGDADPALPKLIELLEDADERAVEAVRTAGTALGIVLADVVNILDPDSVVLGGIYAPLERWLVEPLTAALSAQVVAGDWRPLNVCASSLGPDAAVRGAAGWVIERVLGAPGTPVAA
jgi:predicted NBD/HSP70 family sugar kinase